jgi:hypothetical protein
MNRDVLNLLRTLALAALDLAAFTALMCAVTWGHAW